MNKNIQWHELAPWQQGGIIVLILVQFSLLAAALRDIRQRSAAEINGSKGMWTTLAFINFVGPMAYFSFGRK